jgi:hypothetical protein
VLSVQVPVALLSNVTETDGIRVSGTLKADGDEVFAVTVACWSDRIYIQN